MISDAALVLRGPDTLGGALPDYWLTVWMVVSHQAALHTGCQKVTDGQSILIHTMLRCRIRQGRVPVDLPHPVNHSPT
jgi:hypothetical protein